MSPDINNTSLQQQLRDIHLPDAISWWPLAIGWWVVIALAVIVISLLCFIIYKKLKQNHYRRVALAELQVSYATWQTDANTSHYLHTINALLRRVIKHLEGNTKHTSKTGQTWGNILNSYTNEPLPKETVYAISHACYQAQPDVDVACLNQHIHQWIKLHKKPRKPYVIRGNHHA